MQLNKLIKKKKNTFIFQQKTYKAAIQKNRLTCVLGIASASTYFPSPSLPNKIDLASRDFFFKYFSCILPQELSLNIKITLIAWYKKTALMASLTKSTPLNEKDKFDKPPLVLACGHVV